jgi:hypothetical protein
MNDKAKNFTFSKFFLRNCEFKFECNQEWESLEVKEGSDSVKYCDKCKKDVYLVEKAWDLVSAIGNNQCVAMPRTLMIEAKAIKGIGKMSVGHVGFKKD